MAAVLAELDKYYPGARGYEVAGFVVWQSEKDGGDTGDASRYEQNLVRFIRQLRRDFDAMQASDARGRALNGRFNTHRQRARKLPSPTNYSIAP